MRVEFYVSGVVIECVSDVLTSLCRSRLFVANVA
jgi:hypothetical protein